MAKRTSNTLNDKETKVDAALRASMDDNRDFDSISIEDIAKKAFTKKGSSSTTLGNSWVRNSLRKLRRLGLARKVGDGLYRHTGKPVPTLEEAKKPIAKKGKKAKAKTKVKTKAKAKVKKPSVKKVKTKKATKAVVRKPKVKKENRKQKTEKPEQSGEPKDIWGDHEDLSDLPDSDPSENQAA